ncbi:WGR domain-containing protein [Prosthecobacter sp.]|uniref:WGR domain-containing protein n=1 Tax=Prosthecobacter sp. TaxID=1965333 RepID=UPI002AB80AE8|nr:WGR domain-containing protein [Prosthecobacter sp.]MDZ4405938.1 WGR domain-containing protein [Prosthecobacter sp.]
MESITLYFREGPSDKVYQASIKPKDGGFMVHFAYGRRGATLSTGSKTQQPVEYQIAKGIYDKLIKEKTAKGYCPAETTAPLQHTDKIRSGILPQLLNPVESHELEKLIHDPACWMQEKKDGRRLLIHKQGDTVTGINRLGLTVALPPSLIEEASACAGDFLMDGEAIGDTLHAFDLLFIDDDDIRGRRCGERYLHLMNLLGSFQHPHIELVPSQFTTAQKQCCYHELKQRHAEGVVFKHSDAPYISGRPSAGGTQLKYKFYETASFIVAKANDKRSVSLILFENAKARPAGNVTIPPNHDVPSPGAVVECRYLYAFKESGSIYQPVYLGPRDDIRSAECTTAQLKYKAEVMQAAA